MSRVAANTSLKCRRGLTILGVPVDALTVPEIIDQIALAIERRRQTIFGHQNIHSIAHYYKDEKIRRYYHTVELAPIDGMPLIWFGRRRGLPVDGSHRATWVDWIDILMSEAAQRHWGVFYLGSAPGVAEKGATRLRSKYRGLMLHACDGYFDTGAGSAGNKAVVEKINTVRPDVLMVGMGMPRTEHWILDNRDAIGAYAILTCGAAMDYVAGVVPTAPRWMGRMGLEWAFRLAVEPKRLWRRYLIEPWSLTRPILREVFGTVDTTSRDTIDASPAGRSRDNQTNA